MSQYMAMKKRKLIKENFYLFLLAALIGIACNYFVTKAIYSQDHNERGLNRPLNQTNFVEKVFRT